jgi:cytoskeleton protein RodZ
VADENQNTGGMDLQAAREARGVSVHQLAVELHVSDAVITALEKGDYRVLGEPVFVRGHLRNYARALGLPEADALANYEQVQHKPASPPVVPVPHTGRLDTRSREWSARTGTLAVVVVLVILAITWWVRRPETPAGPEVAAVPAASTAAVPAPATQAVGALTDLADNNQASAAAQTPKPAAKAAVTAPATRTVTNHASRPAAAATRTTASAPIAGPEDSRAVTHVRFTLGAASWVEVYDDSGKRLYYDLAGAGSNLDVSGAGPLQVFLGNAPGVSVELEGQPFDIKPFLRQDNTARFKLGTAAKP